MRYSSNCVVVTVIVIIIITVVPGVRFPAGILNTRSALGPILPPIQLVRRAISPG
jgi:hypothetical protein